MQNRKKLIALWSNDKIRRAFLKTYKEWGVWFEQPQTNCTYYKYDLPDGSKVIVMEYLGYNAYPEMFGGSDYSIKTQMFLQTKEYFQPNVASDSYISNYLKGVKTKMLKGVI